MRNVTASTTCGPSPARARSTAARTALNVEMASVPSTSSHGSDQPPRTRSVIDVLSI